MQKNAKRFGLSMHDFLYENPLLFYLYREVYIDDMQDRIKQGDNIVWINNAYTLRAFRQVMKEIGFAKGYPNNLLFPNKTFTEQNAETERAEKNLALKIDAYMKSFCK